MKILLADDDKIERTALRQLIAHHPNLEIVEVENGQAALDVLCDGLRPDLCIFDIRMPEVDGVELLKRMRRDPLLRGLKVVMTSASRDRDTIVTLAKLQIAGYLLKPYDAAKSGAVLQPLLAAAEANPQLASRNLLAKTALVVDGDDSSRAAVTAAVKNEEGWDVVPAKSGREALARLQDGLRPDLVIVDVVMPETDGAAFISRVREDAHLRSLKIVVASAGQDRQQIATLANLGVRGYLSKPFEASRVSSLLRTGTTTVTAEEAAPAKR